MGHWYRDHVFVRLMDRLLDDGPTRAIRARVCAPLAGEVVELGWGTGLNLPFLPPAVTRLLAVDPLEAGRRLGAERLAAASVPVEFVGLDGEHLPLEDASVDAALCTYTLCSIPDPVAAVREVRRVLRPGGTLHFAEHGAAPKAGLRRWQQRLNPVQRRVACGCELDRDIPALLEAGGMTVDRLDTYWKPKEPKLFAWTYEGVASPA